MLEDLPIEKTEAPGRVDIAVMAVLDDEQALELCESLDGLAGTVRMITLDLSQVDAGRFDVVTMVLLARSRERLARAGTALHVHPLPDGQRYQAWKGGFHWLVTEGLQDARPKRDQTTGG